MTKGCPDLSSVISENDLVEVHLFSGKIFTGIVLGFASTTTLILQLTIPSNGLPAGDVIYIQLMNVEFIRKITNAQGCDAKKEKKQK